MKPNSETHPKVRYMMKDYRRMHNFIQGKKICDKAGVQNGNTRIGKVGYNDILGEYGRERGTARYGRKHRRWRDASNEQGTDLCNK